MESHNTTIGSHAGCMWNVQPSERPSRGPFLSSISDNLLSPRVSSPSSSPYPHYGAHCCLYRPLHHRIVSSFFTICYPMPYDHRYGDGTKHAMPRGSGNYWVPGGLDSSQPSVARDSEDRHGISHICANHLTLSAYTSGATLSLTHSYPTRARHKTTAQNSSPILPTGSSTSRTLHPLLIWGITRWAITYVLITLPNIHRDLFRSLQLVATAAGSAPPSPREWPTLSILPRSPIFLTTRRHMTRRVASLPTASIRTQNLHAIYRMMALLVITESLPNSPSCPCSPFLHHLVLLSSAMLL
jgi:hypothetical protein